MKMWIKQSELALLHDRICKLMERVAVLERGAEITIYDQPGPYFYIPTGWNPPSVTVKCALEQLIANLGFELKWERGAEAKAVLEKRKGK